MLMSVQMIGRIPEHGGELVDLRANLVGDPFRVQSAQHGRDQRLPERKKGAIFQRRISGTERLERGGERDVQSDRNARNVGLDCTKGRSLRRVQAWRYNHY